MTDVLAFDFIAGKAFLRYSSSIILRAADHHLLNAYFPGDEPGTWGIVVTGPGGWASGTLRRGFTGGRRYYQLNLPNQLRAAVLGREPRLLDRLHVQVFLVDGTSSGERLGAHIEPGA